MEDFLCAEGNCDTDDNFVALVADTENASPVGAIIASCDAASAATTNPRDKKEELGVEFMMASYVVVVVT